MRAATAVQAATFAAAKERAREQFDEFFAGFEWRYVESRASAVGTVAGQVLTWDCVFEAEVK